MHEIYKLSEGNISVNKDYTYILKVQVLVLKRVLEPYLQYTKTIKYFLKNI